MPAQRFDKAGTIDIDGVADLYPGASASGHGVDRLAGWPEIIASAMTLVHIKMRSPRLRPGSLQPGSGVGVPGMSSEMIFAQAPRTTAAMLPASSPAP